MTLINSNIQMKPREYYGVFVETRAKSKCSNAGCFCGKDGICVMWLVIPRRGSRVVFWGHVWESKLIAVWSLVPLCYMYQSCSFTWFNLPVINSLEGVQSSRCNDCLLCVKRAFSARAGGYLALWLSIHQLKMTLLLIRCPRFSFLCSIIVSLFVFLSCTCTDKCPLQCTQESN